MLEIVTALDPSLVARKTRGRTLQLAARLMYIKLS